MQNCWEFKRCGREKENGQPVCPAAVEGKAHSVNRGKNGGRICWAVAGTRCDGEVQGEYAQKLMTCLDCDFRKKVKEEEGLHFKHIYLRD
ncbi:MAG TPA: hypothetical protein VFG09_07055 [Thermodesulfovibrionales bacterium]|nr:hypothetical protein [Thermodesulfovibrionales bacterium]